MFSSFTNRLRLEVETIKLVLDTHDRLRALVFSPSGARGTGGAGEVESTTHDDVNRALDEIRNTAPSKPSWQVYDHCAVFTRLYAVYEQCIEDLVSDYLRLLPKLYPRYEDLPERVTTQHRLGIGQILMKLSKDGPYKLLEEKQIISDLAQGLLGNPDYVLLRDAFLIDPQNYRAETLIKLFSYLGFEDCWPWVEKHPSMVAFMQTTRDPGNETPRTLLHDFVETRNMAAHITVVDITAADQTKSIADFLIVLTDTLGQLVMKHVVQRKIALSEFTLAGTVLHKFSDNVVGARMSAGTLAVGEEVAVVQKNSCYKACVVSIQVRDTSYAEITLQEQQEIGIKLTRSAGVGAQLVKLPAPPAPEARPEPLSPDDFPNDPKPDTDIES